MKRKSKVLFLQLPCLDNDVAGARENLPLAGIYLNYALGRSAESSWFQGVFLPAIDELDNRGLVHGIMAAAPDVLVCTLYLWNVERTLRVIRALRRLQPCIKVLAGGPEAARRHPFLFRGATLDAVAVGEGETVFPAMLHALRTGGETDFNTVAWRRGRTWIWGGQDAAPVILARDLPPPDDEGMPLDAGRIGYLETTRGCPMQCSFCRYHHLRPKMDVLPPDEVIRRVQAWIKRGAREVRFIDPTLNAHPQFVEILERLAKVNGRRRLSFFAELKADTIDARAAELLASANFNGIEVGMQSMDAQVLKAIRRPTRFDRLEEGIRRMTRHGIRITLDVMYGLPRQRPADVYRAIRWGRRFRRVDLQCMQTLLLPGTDLRRDARSFGLKAGALPPYGVAATPVFSQKEMVRLEQFLSDAPDLPSDSPMDCFAGYAPGPLFPDVTCLDVSRSLRAFVLPEGGNRRVLVLSGNDLYACRGVIKRLLVRVVRTEPDALWQFVLAPAQEEPLDLIDELAGALRNMPAHILDRYASAGLTGRLAARRLCIRLRRGRRYDPAWVAAAEDALRAVFY
jgi:hypothetical protein